MSHVLSVQMLEVYCTVRPRKGVILALTIPCSLLPQLHIRYAHRSLANVTHCAIKRDIEQEYAVVALGTVCSAQPVIRASPADGRPTLLHFSSSVPLPTPQNPLGKP